MPGSEGFSPAPAVVLPRRVVGLGASAGGLEALNAFLAAFPAGRGCAFIVVQHLAHAQTSALGTLLQQHTAMSVLEATDGLRIQADHVYVITPGTILTAAAGRLVVRPSPAGAAPAQQIDTLFRSLAQAYGAQAVGVVLSGMGHDGSEGLRAIVEHGGLGLAQAPGSAQFDAMPRAAAAIGLGVAVASPTQMPQRILAVLPPAAAVPAAVAPPEAPAAEGEALAAAVRRVAAVTGHDFTQYKGSTLKRRIERRMALHGATSLDDYVRLLGASDQEAELLFKELLIGVTGFFRDPPLWEAMRSTVLPALLAQAAGRPERNLRAWVVGCSTGEEAYTLAMLLREALDAAPAGWTAQVFATDLNADAIQTARRGIYSAASAQAVPAALLARWFVPEGGGWRVSKVLREMVLFAHHDLLVDPPFTRLDLVSCRNVLIYFRSALQQRLLPLFHYALQPGGFLLLGTSETVGRLEAIFATVEPRLRIHRRVEAPLAGRRLNFPMRPATMPAATPEPADSVLPTPASLPSLADRLMLDEFAPPAVLISEQGDILYVSGRTGNYLEPAAGKANWNVHAMAREGLRVALSAALDRVRAEGRPAEVAGLEVHLGGSVIGVALSIRPVRLQGQGPLVLIVFRELPLASAAPPADPARRRRGQGPREPELAQALEEAHALREQMRSSQEELQSVNEELQSTNEELQSANEELTTSKEEMQAMNEELQTVNGELMSKLEDLAQVQSDLKNLLDSTQIATLLLDSACNVRRYTEQAKKVIHLRDSDIGRPLSDLATTLEYPALLDDIAQVARTLEYRETEIRTTDGHWYSVRIMPYRTQDNVIDGSVITFADITAAKDLEARLRLATRAAPG
jgi:two-component system CheB/CheR fusion protein